MITVLIVLLLIMALGGLPPVGVVNYGYGPSSVAAVVLLVILILLLMGRI